MSPSASDLTAPIDRSYAPAVSGTRNASASTHVITPERKTSRNVVSVRNVSGVIMPNRMMKKIHS